MDSLKILVLDENDSSRKMTSVCLQSIGYLKVDCVSQLTDCVDLIEARNAENRPFDVLMMDLAFVKLGGLDLICRLKESRLGDRLCVVITAEKKDEIHAQKALLNGAQFCLFHQMSMNDLSKKMDRIQVWINARQARLAEQEENIKQKEDKGVNRACADLNIM